MSIKKNHRGVALLWSLILVLVLMIVTGTMVSFITKESKMVFDIESSVRAYSNARTGIEWGINYLNEHPTSGSCTNNTKNIIFSSDDKSITNVEVFCNTTPKMVRSTGEFGNVRRVLEYEHKDKSSFLINPENLVSGANDFKNQIDPPNNSENFLLTFDFWFGPNSNMPANMIFGLANSGGSNYIGLSLFDPSDFGPPRLMVRNGSDSIFLPGEWVNEFESPTPKTFSSDDEDEKTTYGVYRAEIRYISQSSVYAKIIKRDPDDGSKQCIYWNYFDLAGSGWSNKDLGDLVYLYIPSGTNAEFINNAVDSDGYPIDDGRHIQYKIGPASTSFGGYIDNINLHK